MIEDSELLYSIALMYYKEGLTQQEISDKTGISRTMISRALSKAHEVGIVEVTIHAPSKIDDIGLKLEKALHLDKVFVAPSDITDFAPSVLEKELPIEGKIGLGWGKTVYGTVRKMSRDKAPANGRKWVVPLVSSLGIKEAHYQVNLLVGLLSDSIGGTPLFYNPSDAHINDISRLWTELDVAVMGLGSGVGSSDLYPHNAEIRGELLGKFFSKDGFLPYSWTGYDAIDSESLLKIKKRICMCSGSEKVGPILTASSLGLFNMLITDKKTADELLREVCKG